MSNPSNPSEPTNDDTLPVFTRAEVNDIVRQRLERDRASRANPPPASTAAPSGADARLDRLEGMFGTLIERLTPPTAPAPSGQAAPAAAPAMRYEQFAAPGGEMRSVAVQPATAPNAPTPHSLPTNHGLVDIWNLNHAQIDQLGPAGIKAEFEKHKEVADRLSGRPPRPLVPFILNVDGSRSADPRARR